MGVARDSPSPVSPPFFIIQAPWWNLNGTKIMAKYQLCKKGGKNLGMS